MRRIAAIAGLTMRGAVRSRIVGILALTLAGMVIGLPLTVSGDGTLEGHLQVLLGFSLGAVGGLLGLAAVGSGCGAMAMDIQDRKIQLLATKPVRPLEIWLGKALGLLLLQGLLLAGCGAGVYGMLRWTLRSERWNDPASVEGAGALLVSRASAVPAVAGAREQAQAVYDREVGTDPMLAAADRSLALAAILRRVEAQGFTVAPGGERVWPVRLPSAPDGRRPLTLQFRFAKSVPDIETVSGIWRIRVPGTGRAFEQAGAWRPQIRNRLSVPAEVAGRSRDLELSFENRDAAAALLFDPRRGVELQVEQGTFETNFLRALGLIYCRLILLTAIGLAVGTMFSLPVAVLCAFCLVLLLHLGDTLDAMAAQPRYFGTGSGQDSALVSVADRGLRGMYWMLDAGVRPLQGPNPAEALAGGRRISWRESGHAAGLQIGLYGGILAILSAASLRRRELGAVP